MNRFLLFFLMLICCVIDCYATALISSRFDNFSQKDGLSNNVVQCVFQDKSGLMWFGTSQGLNMYDGYRFKIHRNAEGDESSIRGNLVRCVFQDSKGRFWVGTESGGLNSFDVRRELFSSVKMENGEGSYSANCIEEDADGRIWVGTEQGLAFLNEKGNLEFYIVKSPGYEGVADIRDIHIDVNGNIWLASTRQGLCFLSPKDGTFKEIPLEGGFSDADEVQTVYQSKDGTIWVGTYYSGVFMVNPNNFEAKILETFPFSERVSTVRAIIEDNEGILWFGTRGGLVGYDRKEKRYGTFVNDIDNEITLVHNSIIDLFIDSKGDLWIGTRGGISYKNQEKQNFRLIREAKNDNRYLNNDEVYALAECRQNGEVWIGTESGGINILNLKTNSFSYVTKENGGLTSDCIKCFLDNGDCFWVGTYMGGVNVVDKRTKRVRRVFRHSEDDASLSSDKVWDIQKDSEGRIWLATSKGVDMYNSETGKFTHYKHIAHNVETYWVREDKDKDLWIGTLDEVIIYNPEKDKVTRFTERTRSFLQDLNGEYWLGTNSKGLALYDKHTGAIKYYTEKDGLANNHVQTISESKDGALWITTMNGLSKFDKVKKSFKNYDGYDGLQDAQFLYNAAYKLSDGNLVVGGINGLNIFDPLKVKANFFVPPVMITDFRIFNKPVSIGEEIDRNILYCDKIKLQYNQNMFSFQFAALSYSKSGKNQYCYMMEGFDNDWISSGNKNYATYTNLNPGTYRFYVKGANCDGKWNEEIKSVEVEICPPFWLTWWFKLLLVVLVAGVIFAVMRFYIHKTKLDNELMFEKTRSRKLHEIEMIKTNFFTNISHELRTPLTLILGPLSQIISKKNIDEDVRSQAVLAEKNANMLLKLVNQLLDYRKVESGKLQLHMSAGDLVPYVDSVVRSFSNLAESKKIKLKFTPLVEELEIQFDEDKINKILNNLLSNAIKYTEEGGLIEVCLNKKEQYKFESEVVADCYEIIVKDNGVGIPPESLGKIFNRFFQNSPSDTSIGTGIGLSIIKEFVTLMEGDVDVDSVVGEGTKFTIHLPVILPEQRTEDVPEQDKAEGDIDVKKERKILLVAEDNADLRRFVVSSFDSEYDVRQAEDGAAAFDLALEIIPDAVITDFIMPKMCGDELCRKLKKNERTSHIPIILLTAVTSKDTELEGLKAGADDYITKPFDINMLRQKLENLIQMQENLRKRFKCDMILEPTNVTLVSPDERFLNKMMEVVEKYISDPELDIEKFAQEVGVSRMQLYRKVDALTNMTVKEFIRNVRIKRAYQLLEQNTLTVSEVAYEVGFKDIAYFRKCFKAQMGINPSEVAKGDAE